MAKSLRVLIVEDSESDTLLLVRQLRKGGYDPVFKRVETPEAMADALGADVWDVILSDYSLPRFNGSEALATLRVRKLDIPFIVVSGAMGEEVAVSMMRAGAHDYLLKDNLSRLVPAVEREIGAAKDRAEHRRVEAERERDRKVAADRERLALVGELAAGVAHEFRNPLHGILNYITILQTNESLDDAAQEDIAMIQEGLQRMEEISRRMLRFTRDDVGPKARTSLDSIIEDAMSFIKGRANSAGVEMRSKVSPGAPSHVIVDGERIAEALLNLLKNAIDASPRRTVVEVDVPSVSATSNDVEIRVTDEGPGVPVEIQERVFDAFFTTKAIGRGSGLGLALARRIAEHHGGTVELARDVPGGTTFVLRFQVVPKESGEGDYAI